MPSTILSAAQFDPITSTLLDSIEEGVIIYDPEFRYQLFNRFMERMSGIRAEDVLGRSAFELFPHLRATGVDKLLERALNGETVRSPDTPYHIPATGRRGWVVGQYSPVLGTLDRPIGVIGIIREVTQRKRVEDALRQSEGWFRSIIENASEMVIVLDVDGTTRYASPTCTRFLGMASEDMLGRSVFSLVHPVDLREVHLEFARLLAREGASAPLEFRCRNHAGEWRTLVATARNLLSDTSVHGVVVNARDVTDQRALELQFQHAQKMDAVGRLAGGIAHDFNNLLSVIHANAQLAMHELPNTGNARGEIAEIMAASERAAALTRQLLTFSRHQPIAMEDLQANSAVEGIAHMLERLLGERVQLTLALDSAAGRVRADRGQLEQVLMNLATNARDAMRHGGSLTISTSNVDIPAGMARFHPGLDAGAYVLIAVRDTGEGMTPEVRARIFEPFFTTKDADKGTGLGLSTVYGIVKQCGGFVMVESELGQGSSFKVYLPRIS